MTFAAFRDRPFTEPCLPWALSDADISITGASIHQLANDRAAHRRYICGVFSGIKRDVFPYYSDRSSRIHLLTSPAVLSRMLPFINRIALYRRVSVWRVSWVPVSLWFLKSCRSICVQSVLRSWRALGFAGCCSRLFTVEFFDWRYAYFIGGGLGISLLLLRIGVFESGIFKDIKDQKHVESKVIFCHYSIIKTG
jgi:hypothetical protein